jgi:hypothetical protein
MKTPMKAEKKTVRNTKRKILTRMLVSFFSLLSRR